MLELPGKDSLINDNGAKFETIGNSEDKFLADNVCQKTRICFDGERKIGLKV